MDDPSVSNAQQELDDEILSACHDGELPPTEVEAVRRRLAREPDLAERLHAMQHVDAVTAGALRAQDGLPLPGRILELLEQAERQDLQRLEEAGREDTSRQGSGKVVFLRETDAGGTRRRGWLAAVAAGFASALRRLRAQFAAKSH